MMPSYLKHLNVKKTVNCSKKTEIKYMNGAINGKWNSIPMNVKLWNLEKITRECKETTNQITNWKTKQTEQDLGITIQELLPEQHIIKITRETHNFIRNITTEFFLSG